MDHFMVVTDHKPLKGVFAIKILILKMPGLENTGKNSLAIISLFHGERAKQMKLQMLFQRHKFFSTRG